jgi:hypothetical protein
MFFGSIDVPGKTPFISERDVIAPDDSCQKYISFKFLDSGRVEIINNNTNRCKEKTKSNYCTLIKLHNDAGKEFYGIRITEDIMPERDRYDKNTFTDEIYLIVFIKRNNF